MNDSEKKTVEIVADQFEKWKNGKAVFFELLADDITWTVSGRSPVSGNYFGKTEFIDQVVHPITAKLKTPLNPELISLTADSTDVWLHFPATAMTQNDEIFENTYI